MNNKKELKKLFNTSKGQIEGIINMIDNNRYCIDISNQILASISILKKCNNIILKNHLNSCVMNVVDKENEDKILEIVNIINKLQ